MENLWKTFYKSSFITSILLLVLGILLVFASEATIAAISYIIGGFLIIVGLTALFNFFFSKRNDSFMELNIIYGIVTIIAGVFIIVNPYAIGKFIPFVIGIAIVISSAMKMQYAFQLKNAGNHLWKATMIISIITTLCGIILLFNPFAGAVILTKVIGIFIMLYALLDLFSTYTIRKSVIVVDQRIEKDVIEAQVVEEKQKTRTKKTKKK